MTQNQQEDLEGHKNIRLLGFGSKVEHNAIHLMAVFRTPVRDRPATATSSTRCAIAWDSRKPWRPSRK